MQQYEAVSQLNSERYARLERAQVLVNQFWETYEELNPWIEETQALISQLPPPAIDHEQLKQQQEDMRVRRWLSPQLLRQLLLGQHFGLECRCSTHRARVGYFSDFYFIFSLIFSFWGSYLCNTRVPWSWHLGIAR